MTSDPKKFTVDIWDVGKLYAAPNNAKKHPEEHLRILAASIKRLGLANPPHVEPDGKIITGTGRWMAISTILNWERIPVVVRHDLSPEEAEALRLSDNKTVWQEFDLDKLRESLDIFKDDNELRLSIGFDEKELERLTLDMGDIDEGAFVDDINEAVETQKKENAVTEKATDATAAPIADAFGFKRMSVEQSRTVRQFMSAIETKTGLQGAEALVQFIKICDL